MRWRQASEQRVWERPNRWRKKEKRIQEHQDNESKRAKEREKDRQRYFELPQYTHTHTYTLSRLLMGEKRRSAVTLHSPSTIGYQHVL